MRERFEYFLALTLIKIAKILPINFIYKFFDTLAIFAFHALKSRRKLAISNLQKALNISYNKAYEITKANFQSIGITLAETLLIYNSRLNFECKIKNTNLIKEMFESIVSRGSGALLVTAHFGNWELLTQYAASIGYPQLIIGREGNNELIEQNLTLPFRQKFGNTLAYKHEAMSKIVKTLKSGSFAGILIDQHAGGHNSVRNKFFNLECYTTKTIATLFLKYKPSVFFIFLRRCDDGRYEPVIKEAQFEIIGEKEIDTERITQICNDEIENVIKTAPHQWFWMHNRWRGE
ncbi:lysophospholipid acyltransferase family protein [Campylobacter sp. faydin G-24]|uniref:Lysophospholipid acyltransferase family protein n=1 Tax=Campylobacter anatolicus TaxID=2829105 RepID=A0ABS5HHE1_9BACT|nr:lysophospholipid acyltransferase family protein [Campylobacter anatolicus]MBR8463430.1 lysophospholipid acyltransferase family protein [Campylobacter anatolicus]MBR8465217.1 lysophospholipid acyltransferase family protein [Campylobacter anatolicus]